MDFSGVRLVVSDMDGTLLNEKGEISSRFFNQFEELKKRNIHFVAASGRQYQSILEKLGPIKDDISIIAENGSLMKYQNKEHILFKLSKDEVDNAISILRNIEGCFIVLCGRKSAYIETHNQDFISKFSQYYKEYVIVDDLTKVVDDDFLKIAVYHFQSSEVFVLPFLKNLSEELKIVVSGQNWLDISHPHVDKSYALKLVQEGMRISKKETMVFGDYNNDLNMLKLGDFSFAMKNAHQDVKKIAQFETKSNDEDGVGEILEQLLVNKQ